MNKYTAQVIADGARKALEKGRKLRVAAQELRSVRVSVSEEEVDKAMEEFDTAYDECQRILWDSGWQTGARWKVEPRA